MAGRRIRHLQRYRDIALALTRHGFGYVVAEMDIFQLLSIPERRRWENGRSERKTVGARIREVLQQLGPTFIKLGQIASTRPDLLPESIRTELEKLQDQVQPFGFEDVRSIIRSETKREPEEIFAELAEEPVAAASIGQVHIGLLHSGEKVAVKIQRPAIRSVIRTDLEILGNMAVLAEARFRWAKRYQLSKMVEEFGHSLTNELSYIMEAQNADRFRAMFRHERRIKIPKVYAEFSSRKMLTMEFIDGPNLNQLELLEAGGIDRPRLASRLLQAVLHQIFIEGFFHADPHPGNIKILPGEVIAFLDFGMVGRLSPEMKQHFSSLIIALMRQSSSGVIQAILRMGLVTEEVEMEELRRDVDKLRDKYMGVSFSQISLGESVNDLLQVAYRHQIRIPPDLIMLGKTLVTIEGVVGHLDPDISIIRIAEPFGRKLLIERFHPRSLLGKLKEEWAEYGDSLLHLPKHAMELMAFIRKGRLEISIPEIDKFLRKLDRISNRLSFSIVLLAFSIIMCGLIVGSSLNRQASSLWHLPVLETGSLIAVFMVGWLIYSILKSGRF
ncbi:ABC1 kinase family protein [Gorillibacterium sp. sgz5001074]|uniref:ABC1 kinase family protein n=1 Tax=Gorillibacterium sp. sgz5001074 TaxID=3446695 RepID=UPI003F66DEE5